LVLLSPDRKQLFKMQLYGQLLSTHIPVSHLMSIICEYIIVDTMTNTTLFINRRKLLSSPPVQYFAYTNPFHFQNHLSRIEFNGKKFKKNHPHALQRFFEEIKHVYNVNHSFHDDDVILSILQHLYFP
jgi:hypothetical protein